MQEFVPNSLKLVLTIAKIFRKSVNTILAEFFLIVASLETARGLTAVEQQELIRRRFCLLNYLLRSPLYDQKSKVCTVRIKRCFSLLSCLLRSPLYDQKSKVCTARIKRRFSLLNYLLRSPLYDQKSKVRTNNNARVRWRFSCLFISCSPHNDQKSKVPPYVIRVRRFLSLLNCLLHFPLYDQKSEICSAASLKIGFLNS